MKNLHHLVALNVLVLSLCTGQAWATDLYVSPAGAGLPPFTTWETAATNIQDAIDAASAGDVVWVTNGVYAAGGKVMTGDLTNRVALDKALTVQSVNGPAVTILQGAGATNGALAVRCAWLTNSAVLKGFTLQGGATRTSGGAYVLQNGGAAWCASSSAIVANCVIQSNTAVAYGAVYQGTLSNCRVVGNSCLNDGAVRAAILNSCTVISNSDYGAYSCKATNCIIYFNKLADTYAGGPFAYCCTAAFVSGVGNFTADPQLLPDGLHFAATSPCRSAGINLVSGSDIEGHAWGNPPSIGCDEWQPQPLLAAQPATRFTDQDGFALSVAVAGQPSFTCWWTKDGLPIEDNGHYSLSHTTSLRVGGISLSDAGVYQVVVSNSFGMTTSALAQVVIHCADVASSNPVPPYLTWSTAATYIQNAIEAALPGEIVLVNDGLYVTGGKVMSGDLTNRVVLDKPLLVQSVNGLARTTLQGAGAANGSSAIRCAWLTNGAALRGFTLQAGATRTSGDTSLTYGGGVWCASSNAFVANCLIRSNTSNFPAAAYQGTLRNCALVGNARGGAWNSILTSCTVVSNGIAGTTGGLLTNCIVYFNSDSSGNYSGGTFTYCCATPPPPGPANISANPLLLPDAFHLATNSPCLAAGTNLVAGMDIDGQPWANPPSIGCDEGGPPVPLFFAQPAIQFSSGPIGFSLTLTAYGQAPLSYAWIKDGLALDDNGNFNSTRTPNLQIGSVSLVDAGNYQLVVSNAFGVATSAVAQVVVHCADAAASNSIPPYLTWATAATNIQDAIDAALPGEFVLVNDGLYVNGGKVLAGDLLNRVALDKPVLVQSVNGPARTTLQGAGAVNGPLAVRCAWLTNGAALRGFTLQSGATRTSGNTSLTYGGGVWCVSSNSFVANCLIRSNSAAISSAVYQGTLRNCALVGNPRGGAYSCFLNSCTIVSNATWGTSIGTLTNCIIYSNSPVNYSGGFFAYCCTTPLPSGPGNISASPQLLPDAFHLATNSPCLAAGASLATGTDIDGQPWANPPSIGCDEGPLVTLVFGQPAIQPLVRLPLALNILSPAAFSQGPLSYFWLKDGALLEDGAHYASSHTTNLVVNSFGLTDAGSYQIVASNSFGIATSAVAQVVVHCVDAAGTAPAPPYLTWATAATNLQDAIDAALAGEFVLVTNGVYATGGRVMLAGDVPSRAVLPSPLTVVSVNGPDSTIIQGAWDPLSINGPLAVRCVSMADGAILTGFTLRGGATANSGYWHEGGGVAASSTNTLVFNCILATNAAYYGGGGCYLGTLDRCRLLGNQSSYEGGGAYKSTLRNCFLQGNATALYGGGAWSANLANCTLTGNSARIAGGGIDSCRVINSIVYGNFTSPYPNSPNYGDAGANYSAGSSSSISYSCTWPSASGTGNISASPQTLDGVHLATTSPCRNVGIAAAASGTDIDGEPWANPPSMGCDEIWEAALTGPLSVSVTPVPLDGVQGIYQVFLGQVSGRVSRLAWIFGDGLISTNVSSPTFLHIWTNTGDYTVTFTAYNTDYPAGVSTNLTVHIVPLLPPTISPGVLNQSKFSLSFPGQAGVSYTIQQTTNLAPPVAWQYVTSWYSTGGLVQITDPTATNAARFYRVTTQ